MRVGQKVGLFLLANSDRSVCMLAETYLTIDRRIISLLALSSAEQAFFDRVFTAYRQRTHWDAVHHLIHSTENPLLSATGGVITREVYAHPLYRAVRDLTDRLGILQGQLGKSEGFLMDEDPIVDSWVPTVLAAKAKGLSVTALHKAIRRGDIIAKPTRPGGTHLKVSVRSLDTYTPSPARQRAGGMAQARDRLA